ncbi:hypothetical protein IV203_006393 [Nitzschia inconspicua]|uniref:Uncharacterized protein n=1 Tax=Nitzschia inconspicua TaxID=303405 RepID=A0A9K3KB70_9STRA|nr:hypothetical protein IV203_006582 [Nitzschia inconspicua]KAG7339990.1 hypothetical protein IV203_006393 [Nitzschia inconspicua]
MTNWKDAIRLNNHAVVLLESDGAANDEAIVQCLQEAVGILQDAIQGEIGNHVSPAQETENQPAWNINTIRFSPERIRWFHDPDFFLFDHAFLLFEEEDAARSHLFFNGRDRDAWIELQSSVVLFNLAVTFHRRALLRRQYEQLHPQQCDAVFLQNTQMLFSKSKLLYTMSNNILLEHGGNGARTNNDLFQSTKFAVRLGIANNMAHIALLQDQREGDVSPIQDVGKLIEEGACEKVPMDLPFEILSGIVMNITYHHQKLSHPMAAAA